MINVANPIVGKKEKSLVKEVLESKMLASGKYVPAFEQSFSKYCGTKYAIATSSGTTALHSALLMCGVKPKDKVITTPFSFIATANSILFCGAKPIFLDIDPKTFNIDPIKLEETLKKEKNVKAVLIVHLYGLVCDMDAILKLKKKYGFKLIEDACQAHGAEFKNKKAGSFSDVAAFSFYATKNMMTSEGGMVLTNNKDYDKYGRQIINHGREGHSTHVSLGYNYRLTNLAAAIGVAQLEQLETWIAKRIENATKYSEAFKNLGFLQIPMTPKNYRHVFHQYTLRVDPKERGKLVKHLANDGISTGIYYSNVIYKQPFYKYLGYKDGFCKEAENAACEVLSIPVHPSLSKSAVAWIIKSIKGYKK